MDKIFRVDNFSVTISKKIDKNGYLRIKGSPTRAGVFKYKQPNGSIIRELRSPEEVFKSESLDTLKLVPLISEADHIRCLGGLAKINDISQFKALGVMGENLTRNDFDGVDCSVTVYDPESIGDIGNDENSELSAGYTLDIRKNAGVYKGERYDQEQINIVYAHVALVHKGRGGSTCRVRVDSNTAILSNDIENIKIEDSDMPPPEIIKTKEIPSLTIGSGEHVVRLDSIVIEETADNLKLLGQRLTLGNALEKAQQRADTAEGETMQLKTDKKDLEKKLETAIPEDRYDSDLSEGFKLMKMAEDIKLELPDNKTPTALKKAICLAMNPDLKDNARFDSDATVQEGVFLQIAGDWEQRLSKNKTIEGLNFFHKNKQTNVGGTGEIDYMPKS